MARTSFGTAPGDGGEIAVLRVSDRQLPIEKQTDVDLFDIRLVRNAVLIADYAFPTESISWPSRLMCLCWAGMY